MMAAMKANGHVSAAEAGRAHHIVWSTRRFRRRSGDAVDRLIGNARARIERDGAARVTEEAAQEIPARLRPAALAMAADLVLVDGAIQPEERTFLATLARLLGVPAPLTREILKVMAIKNSA
jgi:tellurite resistance protein